jgi:GT2 family glycosyltransferase
MDAPSLVGGLWHFFRVRTGGTTKFAAQAGDGGFASVDAVTGACMMIRRQALQDVGPLDEGYFMYAEEADWCYRARQAGWTIGYLPSVQVVHLGGGTAKREPVRFYVERRKSRTRFLLKHHGPLQARLSAWMIQAVIMGRWLATRRHRGEYWQVLRQYRQGVRRVFREHRRGELS